MVGIITSHSGLRPDAKRYVMAGRGVVVDIAGRGDFVTVLDALKYMAARATPGRIWIREGTYVATANHATITDVTVEGASFGTHLSGADIGHAIRLPGVRNQVLNLQASTTGGGGNAYNAIEMGGSDSRVSRCYINDSDQHGIYIGTQSVVSECFVNSCDADGIVGAGAASCKIIGNHCSNNGNDGIDFDSSISDNSVIVGNMCVANTRYGIRIGADTENCVYTGNRCTANTSDNISDSSGTSASSGNDTT